MKDHLVFSAEQSLLRGSPGPPCALGLGSSLMLGVRFPPPRVKATRSPMLGSCRDGVETQGACAATHCKTHSLPPLEGLCGPGNGPQISRGWERFPAASAGLWSQGAQGQGASLAWGHHQGALAHSPPRTRWRLQVRILKGAWSPETHFSRRGMECGL